MTSRIPKLDSRYREQWEVNKYLWLFLLFLALYIPIGALKGIWKAPLPLVVGVFLVAVGNAVFRTYWAIRRGGYNEEKGILFNLVDVALIGFAVELSGRLDSDLWLFYFVLIVSETTYASRRESAILLGAIALGYVASTSGDRLMSHYETTLLARLFFLFMVGMFARRLTADRERKSKELARLSEQLARSEERTRIAREVHDGLGHAIVAIILRLELCKKLMRRDLDKAESILAEEVPALREAWNEGRDFAFHLQPWSGAEQGFEEGLRRNISRFAERTGVAIDFVLACEVVALRPGTQHVLTRVVQESLTNVAKHAKATRCRIGISATATTISCVVEDDGVGLPVGSQEGFGIGSIRARVEEAGGRFSCESRLGSGITVSVTLPR